MAQTQDRPLYDDLSHLPLSPQQARFCEFSRLNALDDENRAKALNDPFTAQNYKAPDQEQRSMRFRDLFGPDQTFTNWVGVISISPTFQTKGLADVVFSFRCSRTPQFNASAPEEHMGGVTLVTSDPNNFLHTNPVGFGPMPFENPVIQKLIATPEHKSPAIVSGHVYMDPQSKLLLNQSMIPMRDLRQTKPAMARFDRVALPSQGASRTMP